MAKSKLQKYIEIEEKEIENAQLALDIRRQNLKSMIEVENDGKDKQTEKETEGSSE